MNKISDHSNDRAYRIEIPQIVQAKCSSPFELSLWIAVKMVAGEKGECYLSTPDLAAVSMMSTGKASSCRASLIEKGLLEGDLRRDPGYPQPVWHLTVPDLWPDNMAWRQAHHSLKVRIAAKAAQRKSLHLVKAKEPSPGEGGLAPGEGGLAPGETKKNQKKNQEEKPATFSSSEKTPSALDDFLGPKRPAEPIIVGKWQDKYQLWHRAGGDRVRSRHGISEDALRHTHYLLTQAGKAEPRSGAGWKPWLTMLASVYEEAGGDFGIVEAAAKEIASRGKFAGNVANWHNIARQTREKMTDITAPIMNPADFVQAASFFEPLEVQVA